MGTKYVYANSALSWADTNTHFVDTLFTPIPWYGFHCCDIREMKWPRDQAYPSFGARCFLFLSKIG